MRPLTAMRFERIAIEARPAGYRFTYPVIAMMPQCHPEGARAGRYRVKWHLLLRGFGVFSLMGGPRCAKWEGKSRLLGLSGPSWKVWAGGAKSSRQFALLSFSALPPERLPGGRQIKWRVVASGAHRPPRGVRAGGVPKVTGPLSWRPSILAPCWQGAESP